MHILNDKQIEEQKGLPLLQLLLYELNMLNTVTLLINNLYEVN